MRAFGVLVLAVLLAACGQSQEKRIVGQWTLSDEDSARMVELVNEFPKVRIAGSPKDKVSHYTRTIEFFPDGLALMTRSTDDILNYPTIKDTLHWAFLDGGRIRLKTLDGGKEVVVVFKVKELSADALVLDGDDRNTSGRYRRTTK